ncbi:hypothetical protein AMRN_1416 [Malaciobacter marinus]|uniref:Uncharacterized protein n=1 Tax=Malaciobacter marinus TaxID=505249 RepID=A0A347TKM4_9BACT|nr:hypothetical protein [Malaciobacter marinus]AXX87152.1 hypothetical protein AMRN_1416 [Malaciobacter marinus]PHO14815.1 hypothetical protein CPH92_09520 [Malaciobacter marinus]
MTKNQREEIEKLLKQNEVAVDIQQVQIAKDENGYPVFELRFENPPTNYKVVKIIEPYKGAVLEDLDFKEVLQDEATKQA